MIEYITPHSSPLTVIVAIPLVIGALPEITKSKDNNSRYKYKYNEALLEITKSKDNNSRYKYKYNNYANNTAT